MEKELKFKDGLIALRTFDKDTAAQLSVDANGEYCYIDLSESEFGVLVTALQDFYRGM